VVFYHYQYAIFRNLQTTQCTVTKQSYQGSTCLFTCKSDTEVLQDNHRSLVAFSVLTLVLQ